jgi:hypothetical protein
VAVPNDATAPADPQIGSCLNSLHPLPQSPLVSPADCTTLDLCAHICNSSTASSLPQTYNFVIHFCAYFTFVQILTILKFPYIASEICTITMSVTAKMMMMMMMMIHTELVSMFMTISQA